jgi:hypothetical protein
MNPVIDFREHIEAFSKRKSDAVRHRIPAVTQPYTSRKCLREQCRIPWLHRNSYKLSFEPGRSCAMSQINRSFLRFLLACLLPRFA